MCKPPDGFPDAAASRAAWLWPVVLALAGATVWLGARPYAGGWNDGSRLATVECLVDHGTLAIDESIFVGPRPAGQPSPYAPGDPFTRRGTLDKLRIGGRTYSDKSPVPALLMAGAYAVLQKATGLRAADEPGRFVLAMTYVSCGLAYAAALAAVWGVGRRVLTPRAAALLTGSFALATVAPVYTQQVNNHLLLLGVTAPLMLGLHVLQQRCRATPRKSERDTSEGHDLRGARVGWLVLGLGGLGGLAYAIDLGAGPIFAAATGATVLWLTRRWSCAGLFLLGALPAVALHHGVTWAVAGTIGPANAHAEYLAWPGSPFTADTMTGRWTHKNPGRAAGYALELLFGKKGFVLHNLPLLLLVGVVRPRRGPRGRVNPVAVCAWVMLAGVWLVYAALSSNQAGACLTIRWFVPLLAPAFYLIALQVRERPGDWQGLAVLSVGGAVLMALAWPGGPWRMKMVPYYWPLAGVTGMAVLVLAIVRARVGAKSASSPDRGSRR